MRNSNKKREKRRERAGPVYQNGGYKSVSLAEDVCRPLLLPFAAKMHSCTALPTKPKMMSLVLSAVYQQNKKNELATVVRIR